MAAHQVLVRTGWIFKTESIVMPAVLDSIAGAGWIRGWLPLLNRFGQSVPPLLLAGHIKSAPRKKWVLFSSSTGTAVLFLCLAGLFTQQQTIGTWMPLCFLAIYALFFMCVGISQVAFGTLQGKLVATTSRGRLLLVSNVVGSFTAVGCAFLFLPAWVREDTARFDLVFGFSGLLFTLGTASVFFLVETTDQRPHRLEPWRHNLRGVWLAWRKDGNFRRLTLVAALFGSSMTLFPHYQNLGLQGMRMQLDSLVSWVIIQNIGTGVFSLPAGHLADRYGNRLVLRIGMLGIATGPALAIGLQASGGAWLFPLVFIFVGLTPVVLRTLQNFTLELCPTEDHPRYLSTLALCSSVPMLGSPLVGLLVDQIGFATVFLAMSAIVLVGWLLTFGLHEPREHVSSGFLPVE